MNDPRDAPGSWSFYDEGDDRDTTQNDDIRYRYIQASTLGYIFEHHAPDKWFMMDHVKNQLPTVLQRTKRELGANNLQNCSAMGIFNLFATPQYISFFRQRIANYCSKKHQSCPSEQTVKDCLLSWLLCSMYGIPVGKLFDTSYSHLYARVVAVSEADMRLIMKGLEGDGNRFSFLEESTGLWLHDGQYDRELLDLERLVASICASRVFVDGATVMSIDDDQLAMRSRLVVQKLGLAFHVNPRKREGIIQVAICDSLPGFSLATHYLSKRESADKGLLASLMHLKGVQFPEGLRFLPGNIIGFDRGFVSEEVLHVASLSNLGYVATVRQSKSTPFTVEETSSRQRQMAESGVRIAEWAVRKFESKEHYVCACREETANKISMLMTNLPKLGPQRVTVKPRGKSVSSIFGRRKSPPSHPLPLPEHIVYYFRNRVTELTAQQRTASWFILRRLRITSTTLFSVLRVAATMAVFEEGEYRNLLVGFGLKVSTTNGLSASLAQLPSNSRQFRGKTKPQLLDLCENCGLIMDQNNTVADICSSLLKARQKGIEGLVARRNAAFNKLLISSWAMKPIRASAAMDRGTKNEPYVLKNIPNFWKTHSNDGTSLESIVEVGLVSACKDPLDPVRGMEATSVDGIGARVDDERRKAQPFLIETKCFSGAESVRKSEGILAKYGSIIEVEIRTIADLCGEAGTLLRECLMKREYLLQVMNHCLVFSNSEDGSSQNIRETVNSLFVASFENRILFCVYVRIGFQLLCRLRGMVTKLRQDQFAWTLKFPRDYPSFSLTELGYARTNDHFKGSMKFALDFASYASLHGPISDDHYIRPSVVPAWNAGLKNGTDIYSLYLSQTKISSTKVPPASIVFFRSFESMVLNASHLFKFCRMGESYRDHQSYTLWRKACSNKFSFRDYIVKLLTESGIVGHRCVAPLSLSVTGMPTNDISTRRSDTDLNKRTITEINVGERRQEKRFKKKDFNNPDNVLFKLRRDTTLQHECISVFKAKGTKSNYCALCTVTILGKTSRGSYVIKNRKGPRVVSCCKVCTVHLCKKAKSGMKSCFDKWHDQLQLRFPALQYINENSVQK